MRLTFGLGLFFVACAVMPAYAAPPASSTKPPRTETPREVEVTADKSLEWYQEQRLYVARGKAKAVRGTTTITSDTLTAHERDKQRGAPKQAKTSGNNSAGDIDLMTAEGNVVIVDPRQRITGDHAVYDLDTHKLVVTGKHLRYETAKEVVTATDSLEYYEDTKMALARGHAVADQPDRHVEGDILTAEFRDAPNGESQLSKMTAHGHVVVITKSKDSGAAVANAAPQKKGGDISRGDHAVYDAGSNVAIISGDVHITRSDGTQLKGDVGEVDFNTNENRLMNSGSGRVQALLPSKTTEKASDAKAHTSQTPVTP